jgi:hypothetical protein
MILEQDSHQFDFKPQTQTVSTMWGVAKAAAAVGGTAVAVGGTAVAVWRLRAFVKQLLRTPSALARRPLLVHLVFHPSSKNGRALARVLHSFLNNDSVLSGLRIPTCVVPEDGSTFPSPANFDSADMNFVVALCDDVLVKSPSGSQDDRQNWSDYIASLSHRCSTATGRNKFFPIQLSSNAWPIHNSLKNVNFLRAYAEDARERDAWVSRMMAIALCRFLSPDQTVEETLASTYAKCYLNRESTIPVTVFISHAKHDIDSEPQVFKTIASYFEAKQPIRAWIDSADIEAGEAFDKEIQNAKYSVLLVLLTKSFSYRTWCRKEVLIAKRNNRPIVVVDAFRGTISRWFPYLGNVPTVSWDSNNVVQVVDLLLKETLRHRHTRLVLSNFRSDDDVVFSSPPEAATLLQFMQRSPNRNVLYPDPPLGDEELDIFKALSFSCSTPMQRASAYVNLSSLNIALSISESTSPQQYGVLNEHLDAALLEITRYLLVCGASLSYGGHLGSAGYTVQLFDMLRAHHEVFDSSNSSRSPRRITNFIYRPLPLPSNIRTKYQDIVNFRFVPAEYEQFADFQERVNIASASDRLLWARGLTEMRRQQTKETNARIVMGGKIGPTLTSSMSDGAPLEEKWYSGRMPGLFEEAWFSWQDQQPLFICGGFGGAARVLADLIMEQDSQLPAKDFFNWDYQRQAPFSDEVRQTFAAAGEILVDYGAMADELRSKGVSGLHNGLSYDENVILCQTQDTAEIVRLVLKGLASLKKVVHRS